MLLPFLAMHPHAERTPSLTSSDSSRSSTSSEPISMNPPILSDRDRALPSIPRELSRKSYRIPPRQSPTYPNDSLRPARRPSLVHRPPQPASPLAKSLAWRRMHRAAFIQWADFYVLLSTCADMRLLWDTRDFRDVVLSHFVPGYSYALRHRDFSKYQDLDISLQDLDLLLISQRVPPHQYPVHALRSIPLSPTLPHGLRELTFPAPLSFRSFTQVMTSNGGGPQLSIFGGRNPPPPPLSEPRSLKYYDARWRRTISGTPTQAPALLGTYANNRNFMSEDDIRKSVMRTHRRTGSSGMSSTSSSASVSPSPPFSYRRAQDAFGLSTGSPHELHTATSRTRAPVLRVFVPCTDLIPAAITSCEQQLIDNGLWEHLSIGDIVCNFGYVPAAPESDEISSQESDRSALRNSWLLYNGYSLVPFVPPAPPPVDGPPQPSVTAILFTYHAFARSPPILICAPRWRWVPELNLVQQQNASGRRSPAEDGLQRRSTCGSRVHVSGWALLMSTMDSAKGGEARARGDKRFFVREKSGGGRLWLKLVRPLQHPLDSSMGLHMLRP
ncbi:hypothetical protein BD769DRAFT_1493886 [Suillus cothurnatus]|nr:hypothetical protein BD769DRAFT_1493886 [Suillus cothurnatus]